MTFEELNQMTVVQLRRLAREQGIVLGSGLDKAATRRNTVPGLHIRRPARLPVLHG